MMDELQLKKLELLGSISSDFHSIYKGLCGLSKSMNKLSVLIDGNGCKISEIYLSQLKETFGVMTESIHRTNSNQMISISSSQLSPLQPPQLSPQIQQPEGCLKSLRNRPKNSFKRGRRKLRLTYCKYSYKKKVKHPFKNCTKFIYVPEKCKICAKIYSTSYMSLHLKKAHDTEPAFLECPLCEKQVNEYYLQRHLLEIHRKNSCMTNSSTALKMDRNTNIHDITFIVKKLSKPREQCDLCGLMVSNLHRHGSLHQGSSNVKKLAYLLNYKPKFVTCTICNIAIDSRGLWSHLKSHKA